MVNSVDYAQVKSSVAFVRATSGFLKVVGPEALSFMQGMVTNDLSKLSPTQGCEVAYLTAKGSMVAFGHAFVLPDGILLEIEAAQKQTVNDFLNKYLISEDAEIVFTDDYSMVHVVGDLAPTQRGNFALTCDTKVGFDAVISKDQWPTFLECSSALFEVLRIEAGMPIFGIDMTEKTIPLEANLESAISYTKGCYIGQEVIARGTHRGQMNKKLMGFKLGAHAIVVGTEVFVQERKVGWLTSVVYSVQQQELIALGYVHRDFLMPGTLVSTKDKIEISVCALPF